ncbi:serine hydrolase domain-containing protein [Streptosporangium sp. NPDC048865]|uniref:serine hydrolase domain-containing protein n=1 Tax=Streptosporangium sp. NPDC048865 TaxID=3155766 RepID=UPI00342B9AAC
MTTHRTSRRAALGLIGAGGLLTVNAIPKAAEAGDRTHGKPVPADLLPGGALDRLIAQRAAADQYSGTYLLLRNGRPVLSRSHGMADRSRSLPNRPDTIFGLGSITKMFTGIAVSQLVQQGRIAYHEKLGTYLDGFPAEVAGTVTVHQLLTHTSGMGDIYGPVNGPVIQGWSSEAEVTAGLLRLVRTAPLGFPPGTSHMYSNAGYVTLQFIVAAVSGQTFYDFVRRHVFRAAGMTSTDFYDRDRCRSSRRIARPYAPQAPRAGGPRVDRLEHVEFLGNGAGGAYSTAADLVAFMTALTGNKLLDAEHTWLATSPKNPVPPPGPPPAGKPPQFLFGCYGPSATLTGGHWLLGHNGGSSNGVSTDLAWYPGDGYLAIDLCNYEGGTTRDIDNLCKQLITR